MILRYAQKNASLAILFSEQPSFLRLFTLAAATKDMFILWKCSLYIASHSLHFFSTPV